MTDANTAALAEHEHKQYQSDQLFALHGRQAQANLLERMLDQHPEKLLAIIEDHGITHLARSDEANKKARHTLTAAIRGRDDCAFGANIIDAACALYVESYISDAELWDEIWAIDGGQHEN